MRLLLIHADSMAFESKKAIKKLAEDVDVEGGALSKGELKETLVCFCAAESNDGKDRKAILMDAVAEVQKHADQVGTERVVVYPYAHLSHDLAPPQVAKELIAELDVALQDAGFETIRAPFGWYKAFNLNAKGHPLAELSREIEAGKTTQESAALKAEKELKSEFKILTTDGELVDPDEFDFTGHDDLKALYEHESSGSRTAGEEPAHVGIMQKQELVDYEPGSDSGNFRWYPKGHMMKRLLENHTSNIVNDLGGMRVETPIMYDMHHEALSKYLHRFPARQYRIQSDDKELFLRFAACFGQYLIAHDMTMSYKHLPLRLYELTHYSFRREQSGELAGLRRLRAFTMPDMHTITADMAQAKEEFVNQYRACVDFMDDVELPYYPAIRFVRSFYEENEDLAKELVKAAGRPALVELWDDRFFYFVMKFEFNVVDTQGKASALSTVQIDVENCCRFDINYYDEEGSEQEPLILHASISGSVDRVMYALMERAARMGRTGEKPRWPFWLAPTQLRIIPVGDDFVEDAQHLASKLPGRVDIDDRDHSVGRKIRDAEKEWVPLVVVVGDKEASSGEYGARVRGGDDWKGDADELGALLRDLQGTMPMEPLPLPQLLSRRPIFRG